MLHKLVVEGTNKELINFIKTIVPTYKDSIKFNGDIKKELSYTNRIQEG